MYPNPAVAIPLPPHPNLEQYRKLAKDLVRACKTVDSEAIRKWSTQWLETLATHMDLEGPPDLRNWFRHQPNQVAAFALARLSNSKCALADAQFVIARVHGFKSWSIFAKHIEALTSASSPVSQFEAAADAVINGDIAALERLLLEDPNLIQAHSTREHQATLLHYVAANGVENFRQKTPKNAVEVAELLLKAGAAVDAPNGTYGRGTALGLVATSVHPWLAGVQNGLLEMLLDHGASVDGLPGGWNPLIAALHNDRPEAAAFLAAHGARLDLEGAAGVGRLEVVRSFFKEGPFNTGGGGDQVRNRTASGSDRGSLRDPQVQAQLQSGFIWACEYGRKHVVEFLLDKGVDLRAGENTGETALHLAAHRGQLEIIRILIDRGAPLEARNVYGGTVLGQATWSVMHGDPSIDFVPTIEALIAAGAKIEEADYPTGNEGVDEVLRRHQREK
jgi:Ankyrin repeats (3 copies)